MLDSLQDKKDKI